jgi:NAD(P)-dependent dehydrogenase (short-subunit alcohol dehydrogenase family)
MLGVCFAAALRIFEYADSSARSGVQRLASRPMVSLHHLAGYPMQQLENRVAIITGASSGIGHAAAQLFARHGARLVLVARRRKELDALVAQLADGGAQAVACVGDVGDAACAQGAVALAFVAGLHALKRLATPDEIARSALYLASDASSFTTGTALLAGGGVSIMRA